MKEYSRKNKKYDIKAEQQGRENNFGILNTSISVAQKYSTYSHIFSACVYIFLHIRNATHEYKHNQ